MDKDYVRVVFSAQRTVSSVYGCQDIWSYILKELMCSLSKTEQKNERRTKKPGTVYIVTKDRVHCSSRLHFPGC